MALCPLSKPLALRSLARLLSLCSRSPFTAPGASGPGSPVAPSRGAQFVTRWALAECLPQPVVESDGAPGRPGPPPHADSVGSLTLAIRMSSEVCQLCLEALTPLAEQCAKAQETDSPLFLATRHFLKVDGARGRSRLSPEEGTAWCPPCPRRPPLDRSPPPFPAPENRGGWCLSRGCDEATTASGHPAPRPGT